MPDTSNPFLCKCILPPIMGGKVLDVGAGSGLYGFLLKHCYDKTFHNKPFEQVDAVDFSEKSVNYLRVSGNYHNVYFTNSCKLPLEDDKYNTVLCIENLEHLYEEEIYDALKELYRVCKERLIISTPPPLMVGNYTDTQKRFDYLSEKIDFISYEEYLEICVSLHKSCINVQSFLDAGFNTYGEDGRISLIECETCIYVGDKKNIDISKLKPCYSSKKPIVEYVQNKNYKEEALIAIKQQLDMGQYFKENNLML